MDDERGDFQRQMEEEQRRQEEEREWLKKWRKAWEAWANGSRTTNESTDSKERIN